MTAVAERVQSKAAIFADAAEALGWKVYRSKLDGGGREVEAVRGVESVIVEWAPAARGGLKLVRAEFYADESHDTEAEVLSGVPDALKLMSSYVTANGARLPFDPEHSDDAEVLAAVANHGIEWTTTHGTRESGTVPRGGMHLRLTQGPTGDNGGARILHFTDEHGFHSVYLDRITEVSRP